MLLLVLPGGLTGSSVLIVLRHAQGLGLYRCGPSLAQTEILRMLQAALVEEGALAGRGKRNQRFTGPITMSPGVMVDTEKPRCTWVLRLSEKLNLPRGLETVCSILIFLFHRQNPKRLKTGESGATFSVRLRR